MIPHKNLDGKTFLISGANGYLGSNLIKYLVNKKSFIFAIYNKSKKNIKINNQVRLIKCDLTKYNTNNKFPKKVDYIIHLASNPNDRYSVTHKKNLIMDNNLMDINFFKICEAIKHSKFLYASSSSAYDDNMLRLSNGKYEKEIDKPYNPDGLYGLSKLLSEKFLENTKLNFTICRIFSIYGNDSKTVINHWNSEIKKNNKVEIWGDEKINRSWLHIDDFIQAMLLICFDKKNMRYFNIVSDENLSLKKIFKLITKYHKKSTLNYVVRKSKYAGPEYRYAHRKNLNSVGFKQEIYLKDGIRLLNFE